MLAQVATLDLAAGRITVGEARTDAGVRRVDMLPALLDELVAWRARAERLEPNAFVFATSSGVKPPKDNLRSRVIVPAVRRANEGFEAAGQVPLPEGITPHGLRQTFASILIDLGENPRCVMGQIGHTDPPFTLGSLHALDAPR